MVSPACLTIDLGLGGSGGGMGGAAALAVAGFVRRVFTLTGSVGATTGGGGGGGGGVGSRGATGSSTILLFLGAESREPFGLPRPRFSTTSAGISGGASAFSAICCTFSELSCEFLLTSAIYRAQEKNYLMVKVKLMFGSPVRME